MSNLECKWCGDIKKNKNSLRNHERLCKNNPNRDIVNNKFNTGNNPHNIKKECVYCGETRGIGNIEKHENSCFMNPKKIRLCPVCEKILHNNQGTTCSYSCANTHFRSGENANNWKESSYRSTCFLYHDKKCVICDEDKIVAVHHFDENKKNNKPENLIPLCPTHHQYCHSRYKDEINDKILDYITEFKNNNLV